MAKVITFSLKYPRYHPKAGQQTYFVEKIWNGFRAGDFGLPKSLHPFVDAYTKSVYPAGEDYLKSLHVQGIKSTTIRVGHRWKEGDWFSPRVWSGRPYNSKQIIIGPDIQVKRTWDFVMDRDGDVYLGAIIHEALQNIAENDGLTYQDFIHWFTLSPEFKKTGEFDGQIICWSDSIEY